jgi:hypothetical protein
VLLLRAVELVVLCGAAADGASKASSQAARAAAKCFEACAVATTVSGLAEEELAYYKDTSKHCTERGAALHAR